MKKHMGYIVLSLFFLGLILGDQVIYAKWFDTPEKIPFSRGTEVLDPDIACVDVKGAVLFPDMYCLPSYFRISHAIASAGGLQVHAETKTINLSQKVMDGMMIYIPYFAEEHHEENSKININKASREELVALPGIGAVTASAIIAYRDKQGPFKTIEDIMQVNGIGTATFANIQEYISV